MYNAAQSLPTDCHFLSQPLLQHEAIEVNLLTMFQKQDIPLHDHPDASGVMLVIEGKAQISRYDVVQETQNANSTSATLARVSDKTLSMGEVDILTSERGNIHGIRALTAKCNLLDITISPDKNAKRNWYLPHQVSGPNSLAMCNIIDAPHLFANRVQAENIFSL